MVNDASSALTIDDGPVSTNVTFGNTGSGSTEAGTITLQGGPSWASLGYEVGDGIFIDAPTGTDNGNGTSFTSTNYYTIAAISGDEITLATGEKLTTTGAATVGLAPVTISVNDGIDHSYLTLAGLPTTVSFGDTGTGINEAGTITLASGTWAALSSNYAVGNGIFVGGVLVSGALTTDAEGNSNSTLFNLAQASPFYTIAAVSGNVITLQIGQTLTAETDVTINLAPVTVNLKNAVNVTGTAIVIEAGQGFLGTAAAPVTVNVQDPAPSGTGSLTLRALDSIYVTAPESDIPVDAMYSASGDITLVSSGSIYDAVTSDFAKI